MYTYAKYPAYRVYKNHHRHAENSDNNRFNPLTNIRETRDAYAIEVVIPGFSKEEIEIEFDNNELKITGERDTKLRNEESFIQQQFNPQTFNKTYIVPKTADVESIEASFNNGILTVNINKKEEFKIKPPREISVN